MNDKSCAIKQNLVGTDGTQLCGGWFKEEVFRVRGCYVTLAAGPGGQAAPPPADGQLPAPDGQLPAPADGVPHEPHAQTDLVPLTVRIWTDLDGAADDESFGVDNIMIAPVEEGDARGSYDQ